jgi:hypothetical protein
MDATKGLNIRKVYYLKLSMMIFNDSKTCSDDSLCEIKQGNAYTDKKIYCIIIRVDNYMYPVSIKPSKNTSMKMATLCGRNM